MAVWRKKIRIQQPATLSKLPSHIPHEVAEKSASRLPRSHLWNAWHACSKKKQFLPELLLEETRVVEQTVGACAEGKVRRRRRRRRLIWFDYCTNLPSTNCLTHFLGIERQNKQTNKTLAECKQAHRRESRVLRLLLHTHKRKEKKKESSCKVEEEKGGAAWAHRKSATAFKRWRRRRREKWNFVLNSLSPCASRNSCRVAAEKKKSLKP
jgi:hypothetical protein